MQNEYSRKRLLEFMDYLATKGLMNKKTASARKAACNNVFSILGEEEASDLRAINIDEVATRFANLKGNNYTPQSLQVYKSRTNKALNDFLRYKENPANFVVGGKQKANKTNSLANRVTAISVNESLDYSAMPAQEIHKTFNVPIPLRNGYIIQLNGIPLDLTSTEAKKIANVVIALATEDNHEES